MKKQLEILSFAIAVSVFVPISAQGRDLGYSPKRPSSPGVTQCGPEVKWEWGDSYFERVFQDLIIAKDAFKQPVYIYAWVADDGKIYDPEINPSSGDHQIDADCLQAVLGAGRFQPRKDGNTGDLRRVVIDFLPTQKVKQTDVVDRYFAEHPEESHKTATWKIPVDVLTRYPGRYKETEIISTSNIRTIKPQTATNGIKVIYAKWQAFFEANPEASRAEIDKFSSSLL